MLEAKRKRKRERERVTSTGDNETLMRKLWLIITRHSSVIRRPELRTCSSKVETTRLNRESYLDWLYYISFSLSLQFMYKTIYMHTYILVGRLLNDQLIQTEKSACNQPRVLMNQKHTHFQINPTLSLSLFLCFLYLTPTLLIIYKIPHLYGNIDWFKK